ncbi:hypothetical protein DSL72_001835 [Monilinia vaccinii-corymbosi]|uniref:Ecp2 effector protein domain-containing protein n=1 Tax=Monilinia vaccinii-corymbosi TaxID=61207 RepID=A0A8A3PAY0_9HELO|nr:hypothetical protein DSL72_001835 [Monilinia vaccinii-corymbosi]
MLLLLLVWLLSCIASSSAYWVKFYAEPKCRSAEISGAWRGTPSRGCQARIAQPASSAWVTNMGSSDDNTVVVFYSSHDCNPESAIVRVEDGCAGIESLGLGITYESFNVIRTFDSARVTPVSKNGFGFQHGGMARYKGVEYKWLKQADGSFRGVVSEEWDDAVLKKRGITASLG